MKLLLLSALALLLFSGCIGNASAQGKTGVYLNTYDVDSNTQATTTVFVNYFPDENVTCFTTWHSWAISCLPGRLQVVAP